MSGMTETLGGTAPGPNDSKIAVSAPSEPRSEARGLEPVHATSDAFKQTGMVHSGGVLADGWPAYLRRSVGYFFMGSPGDRWNSHPVFRII